MSSVGVDVGGTKLLAARIKDDGSIVEEHRQDTPGGGGRMVAEIAAAVHALIGPEEIVACGVGVAGLVDHDRGTFVWGPHVAGSNIAVRDELQALLGVPVMVDNDANTSAYAEHRIGAGRGSDAMLLVTLGTGIGGAMVINGALYRGRGFAGELGHARFGDGWHPCDCGQRGCWETEAAGPALLRLASELIESDPAGSLATALGGDEVSGPAISTAAIAGDPQAIALITRVGWAFGRGLSSLIAILDPDRVVVGGGLGSVGKMLLDAIRDGANEDRYAASHHELPKIVAAELGEKAGAVGAGLLALEEASAR